MRPIAIASVLLVAFLAAAPPGRAEEPPPPDAGRVDSSRPPDPALPMPHVADAARLSSLLGQLGGGDPRQTLGRAARWIQRNVRTRADVPAAFRPFEEIVRSGAGSGPGDRSVALGAMARAAGIPTVWVKTVPVAWIREFRRGAARVEDARAGVFLELHWDGRWHLLDCESLRLFEPHDPRAQLLPGDQWAYDRGADPRALLLPGSGDGYVRQTRAHFSTFDVSRLPGAEGVDLLAPWRVRIAGSGFAATYASEAARLMGYFPAGSFQGDWEENLAQARGGVLVVTCNEGRPVLPEALWSAWLPPGHERVAREGALPPPGFLRHRLADGTLVILVAVKENAGVEAAVAAALEE
jgi:hypothetical protein